VDDDEKNYNYDASIVYYCSTPFTSTVACCNQPKALITNEVLNYEQLSE
jgi:hypothetical protein